jgi:uncharacterized protein (TIGR02246 family)
MRIAALESDADELPERDNVITRSDRDAIEECLERMRLAWNTGDAHAYAYEFTKDATYVIFLGDLLLGREEIEKNHIDVLTKWRKGTRMAIRAISMKALGPDAAIVLTAGDLGKSDAIAYDKLQTFTMVRRGGRWRCAAFQNTKMSRQAKRAYNSDNSAGIFQTLRGWIGRRA